MAGKGKGGKGGKGKGGKGKKGKKNPEEQARENAQLVNDIESEEYKINLMLELKNLRSNVETEDRYTSLYQQERERINYFWIAQKKLLEDKEADLRNKERELQDLKEKHQIEIKVCKQRVKHLIFQNLDQLTEHKYQSEVSLKNAEDEHRVQARGLKYDVRALKVQEKEVEVGHEDYMRALKKEQDKKMTEMRHEFERRSLDLKSRYTEKMNRTRLDEENRKKAKIDLIESKMNEAIKALKELHHKKYVDIRSYYQNITTTNFEKIKDLKTALAKLRKKEEEDMKKIRKLEIENKNYAEPFKEKKAEVARLKEELENYERDKAELHKTKDAIVALEEEIRKWTWEYEVTLQQYKYVITERDDLFRKYEETVYEIQQKSGLKNLILEKKVETIGETLEAKDVQLHQVVLAANLDPRVELQISKSLEDVENAKNEQIAAFQAELKKIREAHSNMVKTYEGKLAEFGIPVEELGFDPLVPANI